MNSNHNCLTVKAGLFYYPEYLDQSHQDILYKDIQKITTTAPFFQPIMPRFGKPLSVKMTNAGRVGWIADKSGYRYQETHPVTHKPWGPIPDSLLDIWHSLINEFVPDCCLVNLYPANARMGLHTDNDEQDFKAPVLSISLGASALFRYGGIKRNDPTNSFSLHKGDIVILKDASRLIYHGIDKIYPTEKNPTRINITMRKAL